MGMLRTHHELTWKMRLIENGYTCLELKDELGRRWGWIINAAATGWDAHVGDFGQASTLAMPEPPVNAEIRHFAAAHEGRAWVEETIAGQWSKSSTDD